MKTGVRREVRVYERGGTTSILAFWGRKAFPVPVHMTRRCRSAMLVNRPLFSTVTYLNNSRSKQKAEY